MKKMTTIWMMIIMLGMSIPAMGAMSISKMRQNARFLTDKMTYELGLSMMQYDDVYEVNYDFINNVRYIMDDVVRGHGYAIDRYYEFLDYRNDDLRWILSNSQYRRFMHTDYFYRPIYTTKSNWTFRIFKIYKDIKHFYYGKPKHYKSYKGEHFRSHFNNVSFYKHHRKNVYKHEVYKGSTKVDRKPKVDKPKKHKEKVVKAPSPIRKNNSKNVTNKKTEITKVTTITKRPEVKKESKRTNSRQNASGNKRTSSRSSDSRSVNRSDR